MGTISQKCLYGIRALFELAKYWDERVLVKLHDIADAQSIPRRFLENILNQLRQGDFVESRRGKEGGFRLARGPGEISIGDVIRFIDSSLFPVNCAGENPSYNCPLKGNCVFIALWQDALAALEAVYDAKSLQNLLDDEKRLRSVGVLIPTARLVGDCVASLPMLEAVRCCAQAGDTADGQERKGAVDAAPV